MSPALRTYSVTISQHLGPMGQLIDQHATNVHALRTLLVQAGNADLAVYRAERETGRMVVCMPKIVTTPAPQPTPVTHAPILGAPA